MKNEFVKTLKIHTPEVCNYSVSISSAKDKDKFIKRVETIARASMEYRDYINFLRENVDMNQCAFFNNISAEKNRRIKIELHHEPFTLYDISSVIIDKWIDSGEKLNDLLIADEVMEVHYNNMVGLVPLSKTIHQVVHNSNKLIIPLTICYGAYKEFLEVYEKWIPEEFYIKLEKKIAETNNFKEDSVNAIQKKFTYIEVDGFEIPSKMETTEAAIA